MIIETILSYINIIAPLCIISVIIVRQNILRKFWAYALVPAMIYISVFYVAYETIEHKFTWISLSILKIWVRGGISLILVCMLIYLVADLIVAIKISRSR